MATGRFPKYCLAKRPTTQSILLAGRPVNLAELARQSGLDHSLLSRLLAGSRPLKVSYAKQMAEALGMDLGHFIEAVDQRISDLKAAAL